MNNMQGEMKRDEDPLPCPGLTFGVSGKEGENHIQ